MHKFNYLKVTAFEADGGPAIANSFEKATPTRSGRYVVGAIEKHVSSGRWLLSTIAWGTPLRLYNGKLQVKTNRVWNNLSSLSGFSSYKDSELIKLIAEEYKNYKINLKNQLTAEEWNKEIPDSWVFNDFGHISIKYFNDLNGNYRKDANENFMSDFIHTVPYDEYRYSHDISPITLPESHGCIHLHPKDINTAIYLYIKIGTIIEIHSYTDTYVPISMERDYGRPPYELHFFPRAPLPGHQNEQGQVVVYSVKSI